VREDCGHVVVVAIEQLHQIVSISCLCVRATHKQPMLQARAASVSFNLSMSAFRLCSLPFFSLGIKKSPLLHQISPSAGYVAPGLFQQLTKAQWTHGAARP